MKKVWRYWGDIVKLAFKATGGEIKKRLLGFVALLLGAAVLAFFFGPLIGIDRLALAGLALLSPPFALFAWKIIAIPAELHEGQLSSSSLKSEMLWSRHPVLGVL